MISFLLSGFIVIRKLVFLYIPCLCLVFGVIGGSMLKAEDTPPGLLQKIQQNSFSMAPSATISLNAALQPNDSRSAEIAKGLQETIANLKAGKSGTPGISQKFKTERSRSSSATGSTQNFLPEFPSIRMNPHTGTPRQIKGKQLQRALQDITDPEERAKQTARQFLKNFKVTLRINNPEKDFMLYRTQKDDLNRTHLRYAQMHQGLRVWPAEQIVHLDPEGNVDLMSGSYVRIPQKLILTPIVKAEQAQEKAQQAVPNGQTGTVSKPDLIIYAHPDRMPQLAWKMTVVVSALSKWTVLIDAINAATLDIITQIMDARMSGSGVDLFGKTQPLEVWEESGNFFMVDTSKMMFDPASSPPRADTTKGGIIILDARNAPPTSQIPDFKVIRPFDVTSNSARSGWLPDAVSATYGFSETYDYYLERHNRNSFDGQGRSIIGVVRVGQNYHNAVYDGTLKIMFFGDARPYAGVIDVVAHELTHGVTDTTANLIYLNQSGALNEAFSDIFGEMVEARTKGSPDWLKGGPDLGVTLQNYANPNSVSCGFGPCPSKMSQYFKLSENQNRGGVHVNSSIINHAFYLLAQGLPGAIGLIDAEKIFFRTLTTKLLPSSQFIDARLAAIASAEELFPNSHQVQKTIEAFDAVEIFDAPPTPAPQPFPEVSGSDATIFGVFDEQAGSFFLGRREEAQGDSPQGSSLSNFPITPTRPSVSGDGTLVSFLNSSRDLCFMHTDDSGPEQCLGFPGTFFSVAMSPDGKRFAMVLLDQGGNPENIITVIDVETETGQNIPLVAPLIDGGTIDVLVADALYFSADSETLFYDALNRIQFSDGNSIGIWSIYSLNLTTGVVMAVVPLVEGFDAGNPALSQTSDRFITFEAANQSNGQVQIVLRDLFTGGLASGPTIMGATAQVFPGYTGDDSALVYTAPDATPTGFSLFRLPLGGDHMTPSGPQSLWLKDALAGVIYRRGAFSGGQTFTLNVVKNGQGGGLVTSVPSGIICGNGCQASFPSNTSITLTATPSAGSIFSGWNGGGCTGTGPCTVTPTSNTTVSATFSLLPTPPPGQVTLQVIASGAGSGTVTSSPAGISCGSDCSESYSSGTGVTLSAVANPGSLFLGWGNGGCSGTAPCVLTLTANTTVSAVFANPSVTGTKNDLDGDGKADLVWRNMSTGDTALWLMEGTVRKSSGSPGGAPLAWQIAGIGDVDGDGKSDLLWRHSITGSVAVWLMNGTTRTVTGFPGVAPLEWAIEGMGDLNGDGKADLVWRNTKSGAVAVWFMNGTTRASADFPPGVPLQWQIAGMGDVDGDGKADVIWRQAANGAVAVWLMNGPNIKSPGFPGGAPLEWKIKGLGDVDGDGKADLVWKNDTSNAVAIWLMNGGTRASSGVVSTLSQNWELEQVGDTNGDGKADVITRNTVTGTVGVWLLDGLKTKFETGEPGSFSTDWKLQK